MMRRTVFLLAALACLGAAPLVAQDPNTQAPPRSSTGEAVQAGAGPRVQPDYSRYEPQIARTETEAAAAQSRTTITITTLGLVLLIVLLVLLLA